MNRQRSARYSSWLLTLLFATAAVFIASVPLRAEDTWENVERIVAIGDIHGDYEQLVTLLRQSGLIDDKDNWIGGASHLVQTGDIPDRGPDSRKALDLMMKLEGQAKKAKGYVHALIGNHEAMNVYGDLRYVDPGEFAAFQTPKSEKLRDQYYEGFVRFTKETQPREKWPDFEGGYRAVWDKEHPLGYAEHREAFGATGKYGKWIITNNVIVKINNILFLHGGIGPKFVNSSVRDINKQAQAAFQNFQAQNGGILVDPEGPLWYRGLASGDEASEKASLENVLKKYGAERMVIAHTPTVGTILPRFDARVLLIDVGISAAYGRRQACLLIEKGELFTLHRGQKLPIPKDSAGLLDYLKKAAALDPQPSPLAPLITSVESKQPAAAVSTSN